MLLLNYFVLKTHKKIVETRQEKSKSLYKNIVLILRNGFKLLRRFILNFVHFKM